MVSGSARPSWQREPCPHWCVVEHAEDDHLGDRVHVSGGIEVPVVALVGTHGPQDGAHDRVEDRRLVVLLRRRDGSADTWLYVGDGVEQMIEVDLASWARLLPGVRYALEVGAAPRARATDGSPVLPALPDDRRPGATCDGERRG